MVLENGVPFLENDSFPIGAGLGGDKFLEVADGVVRVAFDADFFAQSIIASNLDHSRVDSIELN